LPFYHQMLRVTPSLILTCFGGIEVPLVAIACPLLQSAAIA